MIANVVVVGASLAGLNAAETLRAEGYDGRLSVVGSEGHFPYDRPPLSKEVLRGESAQADLSLRSAEELGALDLDFYLGSPATDLDLQDRHVILHGGSELRYDALIIATGCRPRTLPGTPTALEGIHMLRTIEDAAEVRAGFEAGAKVVVVGAGFIGSEVAASARARGLDVTILESLPIPLGRILGVEMGEVCAGLHYDNGVELRCSVTVAGFEGGSRVERVRLADGSSIDADLVVVGVGVVPNTDWLRASGIELDDGVVCDPYCATSAPGVYAAGDVARWIHQDLGESIRVEHWTNAVEQGGAAARNLLAGPGSSRAFRPVPYFWSDQYQTRIQFAGRRHPDDELQIAYGSVDERCFVALYGRNGHLTAALAFGVPAEFLHYRRLLLRKATWAEALERSTPVG